MYMIIKGMEGWVFEPRPLNELP